MSDRDGVLAALNLQLIETNDALIAALKQVADTEADWCVALINGAEGDTDLISRVCKTYLAFRDGKKVNGLRRTERPEAHA